VQIPLSQAEKAEYGHDHDGAKVASSAEFCGSEMRGAEPSALAASAEH
jgi:hypothetical protein